MKVTIRDNRKEAMMQESPLLHLRARGPLACFTRPELKVERVSYPVMTPSAARGILEAILWKPALAWHVRRILILKEINFMSFRRNEVNSKASLPTKDIITTGGHTRPYYADEDRAQRNTVALRDVDYVVEAHFTLTGQAGSEDNFDKFEDMFRRRLKKGQHFHQPYLGCREFAAEVLPADDASQPIPDTRELGLMLQDIEYGPSGNRPMFFSARLENGVLEVPSPAMAKGGTA